MTFTARIDGELDRGAWRIARADNSLAFRYSKTPNGEESLILSWQMGRVEDSISVMPALTCSAKFGNELHT